MDFQKLGSTFFLPLIASPFIALLLGAFVYWIFTHTRKVLRVTKESCICLGEQREYVPLTTLAQGDTAAATMYIGLNNIAQPKLAVAVADSNECVDMYTDRVWGVRLQLLLDVAHGVSAATVSFARGLNDAPKIAGLLVAAQVFNIRWPLSWEWL